MSVIRHNFINVGPLKPMEHNEKREEVDEAVGGDKHSMEVWQPGRWHNDQRQTCQNHHSND